MNVMGKILIVLNLLFALAVGGFLVIHFGLSKNWRDAYEDLKKELQVAKINSEQLIIKNRKVNEDAEKVEQDVKTWKQKFHTLEKNYQSQIDLVAKLQKETNDAKDKATILQDSFQQQAKRLEQENKDLQDIITKRTLMIDQLQAKKDEWFNKYTQANNERETTQQRNVALLKKLQEMNIQLAKLKTQPKSGAAAVVASTDPGAPNPPSVNIETKIAEVGESGDLVQLAIGSDAGLQKGHTLDVYRTTPTRQYLGMIRIVDVGPLEAIGQRVTVGPYASRERIKLGDWVISDVGR